MKPILAGLLLCLTACLTACKDKLAPGHYEGNLLREINQVKIPEPVKIQITTLRKNSFLIEVKNTEGISILRTTFDFLKAPQLKITANFLSQDPIIATSMDQAQFRDPEFDKNAQCFRGLFKPSQAASEKFSQTTSPTATLEFCFKTDRFLFIAYDEARTPVLELSASMFPEEEEFKLEDPVTLNLSGAVGMALQRNFASKISYQQALQARFTATAAYLNLVPHLTTNLIWNAAPNYITFIATLQGLVPFLLPSYWFQAKEADLDRDIREFAWLIMRANLASTTEELTYSLNRDESIVTALKAFLNEVQDWQTQLLLNESWNENWGGQLGESKTRLLDASHFILKALTSDIGDMGKLVRQDRFSLAETLGFHNIEAIQTIGIDQESLPIDLAVPVAPHAMAQLASERSFELKQLDNLKSILRLKKLENYFNWLDPSGDPRQSLGLNTFPQQSQMASQALELEIQRDETKTRLYQTAYKLALDYNEAIETYDGIKRDLDDIHFDLHEVLAEAVLGIPIDVEALQAQAQKYSASLIARQTILANFRIARAKKDRILLAGYFSQILPRLQGPIESSRSYDPFDLDPIDLYRDPYERKTSAERKNAAKHRHS